MKPSTLAMNQDHLAGCPCFGCLKVGDRVVVYLEDDGFEEEIEAVITDLRSYCPSDADSCAAYSGSASIAVDWPNGVNGCGYTDWYVYDDPDRPKEDCKGYGKVLRKV